MPAGSLTVTPLSFSRGRRSSVILRPASTTALRAMSLSAGMMPGAVQAAGTTASQASISCQALGVPWRIQSSATVLRSTGVDLARPFTSRRAISITRVSIPCSCSAGNSSFLNRRQSGQVRNETM